MNINFEFKAHEIFLYHCSFTVEGGEPECMCVVSCNVQGAVISCFPEELQFGVIPLLKEMSKQLTIVNDSPIPANLTLQTVSTFVNFLLVEKILKLSKSMNE